MGVTDTMGGGAPGISWEKVGQQVEGEVLAIDQKQDTDFTTKAPVFWPDGRPKMVPIFTIQTSIRDSDEDDGIRAIWARAGIFTAIRKALQEAFKPGKPSDEAVIGGHLKVRFNATEPAKGSPRKLFIAKFTRPVVVEGHDSDGAMPADW